MAPAFRNTTPRRCRPPPRRRRRQAMPCARRRAFADGRTRRRSCAPRPLGGLTPVLTGIRAGVAATLRAVIRGLIGGADAFHLYIGLAHGVLDGARRLAALLADLHLFHHAC